MYIARNSPRAADFTSVRQIEAAVQAERRQKKDAEAAAVLEVERQEQVLDNATSEPGNTIRPEPLDVRSDEEREAEAVEPKRTTKRKPGYLTPKQRANRDEWRKKWASTGITEAEVQTAIRADREYQKHVISLVTKIREAFSDPKQRPLTTYDLCNFPYGRSPIDAIELLHKTGGIGSGVKSTGQGG